MTAIIKRGVILSAGVLPLYAGVEEPLYCDDLKLSLRAPWFGASNLLFCRSRETADTSLRSR
jgi:hypothetical protein